MSNLLIVESINDKYFIEAFVDHLNIAIKVDSPVCIDEYECLGGIGKLKNKLESLLSQTQKEGTDKIGIVFDADDLGIDSRTQQIQEQIDSVFGKNSDVEFSIFILNVAGKGELETLLKAIKSKESPMADCLDAWQTCLQGNKLNQKDFDKFWIQIYQRYDCCSKKEQKQVARKCDNKASVNKGIYDFDHPELDELKEFLKVLGNS